MAIVIQMDNRLTLHGLMIFNIIGIVRRILGIDNTSISSYSENHAKM